MIEIRDIEATDNETIVGLYARTGLPENCRPDITDPLFIIKKMVAKDGETFEAGFLKITGELYLLIDHQLSTPEDRWEALQRLCAEGLAQAARMGLAQVSCWIPPQIEQSFAKRLESLGFEKSKWTCYTANLT
jgi:hypothetical protein